MSQKRLQRWRTVDLDGTCFMWEGVQPVRGQFGWMMPLYPPAYARKVFKYKDRENRDWPNEIHRLPVQAHAQERFARTGRVRY